MERNVQETNQTTRRTLLRGAVLGGTGIATASLLAPGSASAADAGNGLVFPGVDVVIDSSHATAEVAALVRRYLTSKSAQDLDGWMSFFSRDLITYIDAVVGAGFYNWDSLRASLSQFMSNWPSDGKSYPTRILGDATSAVVFFTDTAGLFGPSEIRAVGIINFRDHKITRQIDYWDGRHFGIANEAALAAYSTGSPTDFGESTVGETAAPAMRDVASKLAQALRNGDGASAAELFAPGAIFEDMPAHLHIVGPRSIGTYLTKAISLLPYAGGGTAVRHVVGSAVGGGYEWTASNSAVPRGVVALELDGWGRITRLTAMWDGSLVDDSTLISLARTTIEQ
ncbi:hypothetical protein [Pseudofrankia sp. BMG5.37]|uniref:hypothetical protein n=1 Tax=Pseudofrankia sp. BMG5.37 TaxID=3050035 RepID=UPI002894484B|nr:hypothetical protein [Pseudofrankia sp. BMG5.37]MDT3439300.1 hypothetical protein [Pseudofrankia sp. BMG5.37]